jgi:hypothetical protein
VQHGHVCSLFRKPLEATDDRVTFEHFHLGANEQRATAIYGKRFRRGEAGTLSITAGYSGTTMYLCEKSEAGNSKTVFLPDDHSIMIKIQHDTNACAIKEWFRVCKLFKHEYRAHYCSEYPKAWT